MNAKDIPVCKLVIEETLNYKSVLEKQIKTLEEVNDAMLKGNKFNYTSEIRANALAIKELLKRDSQFI